MDRVADPDVIFLGAYPDLFFHAGRLTRVNFGSGSFLTGFVPPPIFTYQLRPFYLVMLVQVNNVLTGAERRTHY